MRSQSPLWFASYSTRVAWDDMEKLLLPANGVLLQCLAIFLPVDSIEGGTVLLKAPRANKNFTIHDGYKGSATQFTYAFLIALPCNVYLSIY